MTTEALPNPWASSSNASAGQARNTARQDSLMQMLGTTPSTIPNRSNGIPNTSQFTRPSTSSNAVFNQLFGSNSSSAPTNPSNLNNLQSPTSDSNQALLEMMQQMNQMRRPTDQPSFNSFSGLPFIAPFNFSSPPVVPTEEQKPPEQRFAAQLSMLEDMGFSDKPKCIRALFASVKISI